MQLTEKLLKSSGFDEAGVDQLIASRVEGTQALQAERDQALATAQELNALRLQVAELTAEKEQAARTKAAFDAYREQVEAERLAEKRHGAVCAALLSAGANPQLVELLSGAVPTGEELWDGAALKDPAAAIAPVRERYGALFAQAVEVPTPRVSPPVEDTPALDREAIARMSEGEILANWPSVQEALQVGVDLTRRR